MAHCSLLWFGGRLEAGGLGPQESGRRQGRKTGYRILLLGWGCHKLFCGDATSEQTQVVVFHQVAWWLVAGVGGKVVS